MSIGASLKNWFQTQKDHSVSLIAERMLRAKLEPYGSVTEFSLDSKRNTASLSLLLRGEAEPVTVDIQEYDLAHEADSHYFVVKQVATSREWLTRLLQDFVIGQRFLIPEKYANYAKMLL